MFVWIQVCVYVSKGARVYVRMHRYVSLRVHVCLCADELTCV